MNTEINSQKWATDQIAGYKKLRPQFEKYAEVLKDILRQAVTRRAPYAMVDSRAKDIASFAEKIQRKKKNFL